VIDKFTMLKSAYRKSIVNRRPYSEEETLARSVLKTSAPQA